MIGKAIHTLLQRGNIAKAVDSLPVETNELGFDPWGLHPDRAKLYYAVASLIYRYFRPVIHGIENIPKGRVLLVGNHSGQLPFDGLVVTMACLLHGTPPRLPRPMVERWFAVLPYINILFSRGGAVLGDPINCRNLLEAENAILVFPEGVKGSGKTWWHRYQLAQFGRGFMRLALQTNTPIVPVAIIGGEESIISVYDFKPLARLLKTPYAPIPPHLFLVGLLAFWPLPVRFHIYFGEPMYFTGPFDDEDEVIDRKVKQVTDRLQKMIDDGLAKRRSVFR